MEGGKVDRLYRFVWHLFKYMHHFSVRTFRYLYNVPYIPTIRGRKVQKIECYKTNTCKIFCATIQLDNWSTTFSKLLALRSERQCSVSSPELRPHQCVSV